MKTVEEIIDEAYEHMFHEVCKVHDDLYELKIEYKEASTGKTIIRSWRDREDILSGELKVAKLFPGGGDNIRKIR